ncbi:fimbrillin family protein [Bacteroides fragilis]|uniref:fimbrillin family protein n=1 Tax=Bacteroides fragilis TaxID=817 RepID=UPI0022AA460A|nr:fimbrillin family protein [Bacteroides fragilis]MCZ2569551.1 fimbrillin family protein [Bacteroides fragilis]
MDVKKNFYRGLGNRSLPVLFSVLLFASCQDDLQTSVHTGPGIRFSVSEDKEWHATRAAGSPAEATTPRDSLLGVLPLQAADGGEGLYLHAMIADGIEVTGANGQIDEPQTRGSLVEADNFYDSFGVLASVYTGTWSEDSCLPDYMYDVEVTEASAWTTSYYWPGASYKMKFFAYAPKDNGQYVLSGSTHPGSPSISVTIPSDVNDQEDLFVAQTAELAGNTNTAVALTFNHALTAVRFVCGDDMQGGTVKSVALKNVYSKGTFNYETRSWSDVDTPASFLQTLDKSTTGTPEEVLTTDAQTFMMIPQTLPDGAQIEVVFTDYAGTDHTLTADIKGTVWPIGKTVTYKISSSSINWSYTLTVTGLNDFTYTGGTQQYSVTSYRKNGKGVKEPVEWKTQFSEDGGVSWTDIKPAWLTGFTASGAGGETPQSYNVSVSTQTGNDVAFSTGILKDSPVKGSEINPFNLANQSDGGQINENTANCYVVSAPGYYSFPMVYGNAIRKSKPNPDAYTYFPRANNILSPFINHLGQGITDPYIIFNHVIPDHAELLWEDALNLVTDIKYNPGDNGGNISFKVDKTTIRQGNAVICIKDEQDQILWSWHIWVTDMNIGTTIPLKNSSMINECMKYPLGYCEANSITYPSRSCRVRFVAGDKKEEMIVNQNEKVVSYNDNIVFYQWGRKDPFIPSDGSANNKIWYDQNNNPNISSPVVRYYESKETWYMDCISYPNVMYTLKNKELYRKNLWDNMYQKDLTYYSVLKTIYDPCPVGFTIPGLSAFQSLTKTGNAEYANTDNINGIWDGNLNAWKMNLNEDAINFLYLYAFGYRKNTDGNLSDVGKMGFYWLSDPSIMPLYQGYRLDFKSDHLSPMGRGDMDHSFGVTPIKEMN